MTSHGRLACGTVTGTNPGPGLVGSGGVVVGEVGTGSSLVPVLEDSSVAAT